MDANNTEPRHSGTTELRSLVSFVNVWVAAHWKEAAVCLGLPISTYGEANHKMKRKEKRKKHGEKSFRRRSNNTNIQGENTGKR